MDVAASLGADDGRVELQLLVEGRGRLAGETDHAQAVGAVRGDLEFDDMVVIAEQCGHVVAGLHVLVQDQDAVGEAVRELALLGVKVSQCADAVFCRVIGDQVALVQVLAARDELGIGSEAQLPQVHTGVFHVLDLCGNDLAEDAVTGLDVGADRGLFGVDGLVVAEDRGRLDDGIGEVVLGHVQLFERAEHAVRHDAAQLALRDCHAAGEPRVVQRRGHEVAHMDVPGAGADLHGIALAHVELQHQHMVGVRVALDRQDAPHLHVFHAPAQILGGLHLRARDGHSLVKFTVADLAQRQIDILSQPFSGQYHFSVSSLRTAAGSVRRFQKSIAGR